MNVNLSHLSLIVASIVQLIFYQNGIVVTAVEAITQAPTAKTHNLRNRELSRPHRYLSEDTDNVIIANKNDTFSRITPSNTRDEGFLFPTTRIVGGKNAEEDRFSYLGALVRSDRSFLCGGSLIAPNWMLTAAHCSDQSASVIFGIHNLAFDFDHEEFEILQKIKHPKYNDVTQDNDFALFELSGTPTMAKPVTWNNDESLPIDKTVLTAAGWGRTETGSASYVPKEVDLTYMSNYDCNRYGYGQNGVKDSMLCAGGWLNPGKDSCVGDSGGPLVEIIDRDNSDLDVLYGVVSWGSEACADKKYPGVYARVSSVAGWIESTIVTLDTEELLPDENPLPPITPEDEIEDCEEDWWCNLCLFGPCCSYCCC